MIFFPILNCSWKGVWSFELVPTTGDGAIVPKKHEWNGLPVRDRQNDWTVMLFLTDFQKLMLDVSKEQKVLPIDD